MSIKGLRIGFAITGSFCTIKNVLPYMNELVKEGADILPIISLNVDKYDTRFIKASELKEQILNITGKNPITNIVDAEPIGPKNLTDIMVVAPCTGNTIAKLAYSITDTPVLMAVKANLRNNKPVVISVASNDGLGNNAKNIGMILNMKNIYVVPFGQDGPFNKSNSLMSKMSLIKTTIESAIIGKQIQPIILGTQELK